MDVLKVICAFLIVCIHAPFKGAFGEYFVALTRIAVPIFFMITGYFYNNTVRRIAEKKQLIKILLLFIGANLLYSVWNIVLVLVKGEDIIAYFSETFTIKSLCKFIVLNESPFNGHLWYLGAILYVLLIAALIGRISKNVSVRNTRLWNLLYILIPILLIGDLVFGKYAILIWGREFPYILVRNFLFVGIPYFCIGKMIFERKERTCKYNESKNNGRYILLIIAFCCTTLLERYLLVANGLNATRDHYISTTFLAIAVFSLFLKIDDSKQVSTDGCKHRLWNYMAVTGRKDSTWIYILHPIFITVITWIVYKIGVQSIYSFVQPIIIFIVTTITVKICRRLVVLTKSKYEIRRNYYE